MGKEIKSYEEFVNEEINLKKAISGAAIGAGLAFGSPNIEAKPISNKTEQIVDMDVDFSEVIYLESSLSKNEIFSKILSQLRNITGVRILSSSPDFISCSIRMNSKPQNSVGQTNGNLNIYIKDGRFKVEFFNINFIYIGQQPTSTGQNIARNIANVGRTAAIGTVSNMIPDRIVGNMVGQAINQATRPQTTQRNGFTFEEIRGSSRMSGYVNSVTEESNLIIDKLRSAFGEVHNDW